VRQGLCWRRPQVAAMPELQSPFSQRIALVPPGTPVVVLDTNVVLDWLLFQDAACSRLSSMLLDGQLHWHATASMRSELASVLPRRQFQRWAPDCEHILSVFDRLTNLCPQPPCAAGPTAKLRCRDPDDQKFIDLAVAVGARWLLSKDRALLTLARPAGVHGVQVLTPTQWQRLEPVGEGRVQSHGSGRRRGHPRRPPTPPYVRFRIRRFMLDSGSAGG
jgi:putative PIN family toxin of toxin-antitoxin system